MPTNQPQDNQKEEIPEKPPHQDQPAPSSPPPDPPFDPHIYEVEVRRIDTPGEDEWMLR